MSYYAFASNCGNFKEAIKAVFFSGPCDNLCSTDRIKIEEPRLPNDIQHKLLDMLYDNKTMQFSSGQAHIYVYDEGVNEIKNVDR